ncbi:MAG TPA: hypothetical protein VGQ17_09950 [Gemmatimonadales bacterium]|jgi:hypothetical protein|nr:hypothetical protein [Gemmatimonadales bacterium]
MRLALNAAVAVSASLPFMPASLAAQRDTTPASQRDRGPGIATSMFGTYIRPGELLVYPFIECYHDHNFEYDPLELGYGLDRDFRGRYRATEGLLFLGYGLNDWLAVELEAAVISARLDKAPGDPSALPARLEQSGVGDVEGQVRFRMQREAGRRPEIFGYFESAAPVQTRKLLIGTPDWEFKLGAGFSRGYRWGTLTFRLAAEYGLEEDKPELGEYALEYLRRLSPSWRVYAGIEGSQDEVELITEAQWRLARWATLKLNNALGITSKATDWAPEVGVMFSIPLR